MRLFRRLPTVLLACALLAACTGDAEESTSSSTTTTSAPTTSAPTTSAATSSTEATTTSGVTTTTLGGTAAPLPQGLPAKATFAAFTAVPLIDAVPTAIPDHPTSLEGVYWDFKVPEELQSRLAETGSPCRAAGRTRSCTPSTPTPPATPTARSM